MQAVRSVQNGMGGTTDWVRVGEMVWIGTPFAKMAWFLQLADNTCVFVNSVKILIGTDEMGAATRLVYSYTV